MPQTVTLLKVGTTGIKVGNGTRVGQEALTPAPFYTKESTTVTTPTYTVQN